MVAVYLCLPERCGYRRSWHCRFTYIEEEYILIARDDKCKISIDELYIVDDTTGKRADVIKTTEW